MADGISARLAATQARKFGLTVGTAFVVLGGILLWRTHQIPGTAAVALGGLLLAGALVAPRALVPVERVWMRFAHAISLVTTPIIMGIVYFVVIAPMGVFMRAIGRNPLRHPGSDETWWVSRQREQGRRGGMERQF